jgi:Cofilin/tropomyosin-type actin-binding protein
MMGLGENFDLVLGEIEKVRKKDLIYTIFGFKSAEGMEYKICESFENPSNNNKHSVKDEAELRRMFEVFRERVQNYGCCYALFDFEANLEDGSCRSFLCLITMIPDDYGVKEKFLYSSHLQSVTQSIGAAKIFQINSYEDLSYESFRKTCLPLKKGF